MPQKPVVLHVDDDADIREIVSVALELVGGLQVVQCASGREAVQSVATSKPDLFLLDVMMPEMGGVETLRRLRDVPGFDKTPAFFMTAKPQDDEVEKLRSEGAVAVIAKPFDSMTISDQLIALYNAAMEARA